MSLTDELKAYALSIGFDLAGIASAEPFPDAERLLLDRIDRGLMRGLDWFTLERARFSANPRNHMPEARSVVSLGMSYLSSAPTDAADIASPVAPVEKGGLLGAQPRWPNTAPCGPAPVRVPTCHQGQTPRADPTGGHEEGWSSQRPGMGAGRSDPALDPTDDAALRGIVARYAWGEDYHRVIGDRLKLVAAWLHDWAGAARPARLFVDTGRMIDRAVAQRAGIGWFGKNSNVLTRSHGSWVFLAEVLTDVPLQPDQSLKATCGSCTRCIEACPTRAIVGPGVLDNARCISFLTIELRGWMPRELRPFVGNWIFGCDVCQDVCPVNRKARPGDHPELAASRGIGPAPALLPLLRLTDDELRARFRGTPITRTKRRWLVRNVAVALGNLGIPRAVPALAEALDDPDPVIRGHVAWALGRIGGKEARAALEAALAQEEDAEARREVVLALEESG